MPVLAYDYPLWNAFLTILWFAILFGWIMALFRVIGDVFSSDDMGGLAKGVWIVVILVLPILGVLVYVIARGDKMAERTMKQGAEEDAAARAYIREAAATSPADELAKMAQLRDQGVISDAEFQQAKARIVG